MYTFLYKLISIMHSLYKQVHLQIEMMHNYQIVISFN